MDRYGKFFDWVAETSKKIEETAQAAAEEHGIKIPDSLEDVQKAIKESTDRAAADFMDSAIGNEIIRNIKETSVAIGASISDSTEQVPVIKQPLPSVDEDDDWGDLLIDCDMELVTDINPNVSIEDSKDGARQPILPPCGPLNDPTPTKSATTISGPPSIPSLTPVTTAAPQPGGTEISSTMALEPPSRLTSPFKLQSPKDVLLQNLLSVHHPDYWIYKRDFAWLCVALLTLVTPKGEYHSGDPASQKTKGKDASFNAVKSCKQTVTSDIQTRKKICDLAKYLSKSTQFQPEDIIRLYMCDITDAISHERSMSLPSGAISASENNFRDVCRRMLELWRDRHPTRKLSDHLKITEQFLDSPIRLQNSKVLNRSDDLLLPWFDTKRGKWYFEFPLVHLLFLAFGSKEVEGYRQLSRSFFDPISLQRDISRGRAASWFPSPMIHRDKLECHTEIKYQTDINGTLSQPLTIQKQSDDCKPGDIFRKLQIEFLKLIIGTKTGSGLSQDWIQIAEFLELLCIAEPNAETVLNSEGLLIEWTSLCVRTDFILHYCSDMFISPLLFELSSLILKAQQMTGDIDESLPLPIINRDSPLNIQVSSKGGLVLSQECSIVVVLPSEEEHEYRAEWELTHPSFFRHSWLGLKSTIILGGLYMYHTSNMEVPLIQGQEEDPMSSFTNLLNSFVVGSGLDLTGSRIQRQSARDELPVHDSYLFRKSMTENAHDCLLGGPSASRGDEDIKDHTSDHLTLSVKIERVS